MFALLATFSVAQVSASSYYPVSHEKSVINSRPTIIQTYKVDSWVSPDDFVPEYIDQDGYRYFPTAITIEEEPALPEKKVVETVKLELLAKNATDAMTEAVGQLQASINYEDDDFSGVLYVIPDSVVLYPNNERNTGWSKTTTKNYYSDYNDNSIIQKTITQDGYTWNYSSHTWVMNDISTNTSIPAKYTAVTTYSRSGSSVVNDGYYAEVEYEGSVQGKLPAFIKYTITFEGQQLIVSEPNWVASLFGSETTVTVIDHLDPSNQGDSFLSSTLSSVASALSVILAIVIIIAVIVLICKLIAYINNSFVTIYARDEHSGKEARIQRVWLSNKTPTININALKAPDSRHFCVVVNANKASKLLGKEVIINVDKTNHKHVITQSYNQDYTININLD